MSIEPINDPSKNHKIPFVEKLKGFSYLAILTVSAQVGSIAMMGMATPLAFIPKTVHWHSKIIDRIIGFWFLFCCSIMELLLQQKFRITGDPIIRKEKVLYIMNHRTRFDWMWIWPMLYHYGRLRNLKIVLKSPLKWVPGMGWACQQAAFMFLNRHWDLDRENMKNTLDYFNLVDKNFELLVFPEGTDLRPETKESSERFAEKNNLPKYEHVLHPRTTGFEFLVNEMRKNNQISYVCDVTVGYPINVLQDEVELCQTGAFPKEVHFHVEKFDINELPLRYTSKLNNHDSGYSSPKSVERTKSTPENTELPENQNNIVTVADWLNDRWRKKEQTLKEFYSEPDPYKRRFSEIESKETYHPRKIGLVLSILIWPVLVYSWIYLLITSRVYRCFQGIVCLFYIFQLVCFDGFDLYLAVVSKLMLVSKKAKTLKEKVHDKVHKKNQ